MTVKRTRRNVRLSSEKALPKWTGLLTGGENKMANNSDTPNELEYNMYSELKSGRWDRRKFLQQATAVGISVPMIGSIIETALPGAAAAATVNVGGTATIGTNVPTALPDPAMVLDQGGIVATQIAGEYLMYPGTDWVLKPQLALSLIHI